MSGARGLLWLAAAALCVAGIGLYAASELRSARIEAAEALARHQSEAAVMRARLTEMAAVDAGAPSMRVPALVAEDALAAELALQADLLALAEAQGIQPLSFGPALLAFETDRETVGFELEFEAGYDAAMALLEALEQHRPELGLSDLWLRHLPAGALGDVATPVSLRLVAWSFWTPGEGG